MTKDPFFRKNLPWIYNLIHLKWIHLKVIDSNLILKLFFQQNYSNLVLVGDCSTNESVLANSKMILSLLLSSYPAHCPNETFLQIQKYYGQIMGAKNKISKKQNCDFCQINWNLTVVPTKSIKVTLSLGKLPYF